MSEIRLELLIGRKVHDINGKKVGRIEEIRGEKREKDFLVEAFLIGASALIDRLAAWNLVRPIRGLLPRSVYSVYRVDWQDMDLSDPHCPRLRMGKDQLRRVPT